MSESTEIDENTAFELSERWHQIEEQNQVLYEGVSLGRVLQISIFEGLFSKSNTQSIGSGIVEYLKKANLEWLIRFCIGKVRASAPPSGGCDVLVVYDVNNKMMIDTLNCISRALLSYNVELLAVPVDHRIAARIDSAISRKSYWSSQFTFSDEARGRSVSGSLRKQARRNRSAYLENIRKVAELPADAADRILSYFESNVRELTREIIALQKLLAAASPKAVLMATDAHRVSRIVAQLARARNIPSFVMQHGAPVWKYGYLPVMADHLMVWGEESKKWFTDHGVGEEKLKIVGNPVFDRKTFTPIPSRFPELRKLVLLTNPIDRELMASVADAFCQSAREWKGEIVIKLHPSEHDVAWYQGRVPGELRERVRITNEMMHAVGIGPGDVCVVANSTSGIDAVFLGAIVVNVALAGMPNPIAYGKHGIGIQTDTAGLSGALRAVLGISPEELDRNRTLFLEQQMYRLDGKSASRAAGFIHSKLGSRS